ncbi:MAG: hypothetical protein PW845_19195 [Pseudomonas sp.]|nr:hypothetical protein [Pseudomonas sp.]
MPQYQRLRWRSDAADVAQDTCVRLFRPGAAPLAPDLRQPMAPGGGARGPL